MGEGEAGLDSNPNCGTCFEAMECFCQWARKEWRAIDLGGIIQKPHRHVCPAQRRDERGVPGHGVSVECGDHWLSRS